MPLERFDDADPYAGPDPTPPDRWVPPPRPCLDVQSLVSRRRDAARRLPPLDCGCRDPWPCRCTEPPLSERAIDGYRDAARHIIEHGQTPLVPIEVLRALYRRGGSDRQLAKELHEAAGVIA
jgi:hypothetical protein